MRRDAPTREHGGAPDDLRQVAGTVARPSLRVPPTGERFTSRCGVLQTMRQLLTIGAVAALTAAPAAEARTDTIPCRAPGGYLTFKVKPRNCTLGGRFGYQQIPLRRIRWRSWGGSSSYGRGTWFPGMGVRWRTRFVVYRPRRCVGS